MLEKSLCELVTTPKIFLVAWWLHFYSGHGCKYSMGV